MAFLDVFKKLRTQRFSNWQEFGTYQSRFTAFGGNVFASDIVRSCIRPLALHSAKANAKSSNKDLQVLLNGMPNMYQTSFDFLYKIRTRLEIYNNAFIVIERNDRMKPVALYPVPYDTIEALESGGELFIRFKFKNGSQLTASWNDVVALRYDYNSSDIMGDDNRTVLPMLELIETTNQGIGNAVKATANLRGILKSTKAMLAPEALKKAKDDFVKDYMNLENEGGIASLDATQEFTPITMQPVITSFAQMKEFRENIYRHFGVNDSIIMSDYTESQMEAFYQSKIEPFLVAISTAITERCFSEREKAFGAYVIYESNRLQFASASTKLNLVALVDRGALTPNEWRKTFNLAPIPGGDTPLLRLDTAKVTEQEESSNDEE